MNKIENIIKGKAPITEGGSPPKGPPGKRGGGGGGDDDDGYEGGFDDWIRTQALREILHLCIDCGLVFKPFKKIEPDKPTVEIELDPKKCLEDAGLLSTHLTPEIIEFVNSPKGYKAADIIRDLYTNEKVNKAKFLDNPGDMHPSILHQPSLAKQRDTFIKFLKNKNAQKVVDLIVKSDFEIPCKCITGLNKQYQDARKFLFKIVGNKKAIDQLEEQGYKVERAAQRAANPRYSKMFSTLLETDGAKAFYENEAIFAAIAKNHSQKDPPENAR